MANIKQNNDGMFFKIPVFLLATAMIMIGCTSLPKGLKSVTDFDFERYLGRWYEIARLDHSFERDLHHVSAIYERKNDGTIRVLNSGLNSKTGEWKKIEGKARFLGRNTVGSLKVSFFGPFYSGYHIIDLDKQEYSYAMVAGPNRSYLWILSRNKSMDKQLYSQLVAKAKQLGFETEKLILVDHTPQKTGVGGEDNTLQPIKGQMAHVITPCPKKPNCVSSLENDRKKFVPPLAYKEALGDVRAKLMDILNTLQRVEVVTVKDNFIQARFVSSAFGFIDDVWIFIDDRQKIIHLKSASRSGFYDFGVNRRRIEHIRKRFEMEE